MMKSSKINILVIEDNQGDFVLVNEFLNEAHSEVDVHHCINLTSAILEIKKLHFSVILLDLSLPDSDGIRSVSEVVEITHNCPVIVLTGYGDKDFGIETLAAGVEDYLVKDEINSNSLRKSIDYSIERYRIRKELNKHQALFEALIEKSTDMKTLITPKGELLYGTPSITKVLGYTPQEMIGKHESDFVHPDDLDLLFDTINNVLENEGESSPVVIRVKHKSGAYHWCEKTITNLLHEPDVAALVCNFWDMTERMFYIKEIEKQNTALKEIAWVQSHEVRAPVTRIMGIVNLLKLDVTALESEKNQLLDYLMQSANELDLVIKGIVEKAHKISSK